jgi:hypothetical protein
MTLHRPDIPSMASSVASQHSILSPSRSSGTGSDLSNNLRRLSISRSQSNVSLTSVLFNNSPRSNVSTPFQLQPTYSVMPIVYHGVPLSPPYTVDQAHSRGQSTLIPPNNYSLVRPVISHSGQIVSPEFMTPRHFQPRADGRRHNAMRIARSHAYNPNSSHNHVEVNRIREGIDVRTTVCCLFLSVCSHLTSVDHVTKHS